MESVFLNGGYIGATSEYLTTDVQISTIEFVASSFGRNQRTVVVPATAQVGDIAVVIDNTNTGSSGGVTGWTKITDASVSSNIGIGAYYKIVTAGDIGATFTATDGDTTDHFLLCSVWRPQSPAKIASVIINDTGAQATTGNPSLDTLLMSAGTPPLIGFIAFCQRGSNNASISIATEPVADGYVECLDESSRVVIRQYHKVYDAGTTPADMSGDLNDAGVQGILSWYFTFTSESGIDQYNDGIWNLQSVLDSVRSFFDYESGYGTPTYTITSFPSVDVGVQGDYDCLIAIDANIGASDDGVLIDLGGSGGAGLAAGVNNGIFRVRAFESGGDLAWGTGTAACYIEANISSYTGNNATYYIVVDQSTFTLKLFVQPGGTALGQKIVLLGESVADGTRLPVYGSNDKGYGQVQSNIADLGASYEVNFNGTINQIRYWSENPLFDFSEFAGGG